MRINVEHGREPKCWNCGDSDEKVYTKTQQTEKQANVKVSTSALLAQQRHMQLFCCCCPLFTCKSKIYFLLFQLFTMFFFLSLFRLSSFFYKHWFTICFEINSVSFEILLPITRLLFFFSFIYFLLQNVLLLTRIRVFRLNCEFSFFSKRTHSSEHGRAAKWYKESDDIWKQISS